MGQIAAIYPAATVTVTPAPPAPLPQATTTVTVTATPGTQPTSAPTPTATQVTSAPVSPAPTATTTVTVTAQPPVLEPGRLPDAQGFSLQRGVACTVSPRYELHGVDPKSVKFKENVGATLSADAKTMTVPG